jgi:hypothetical protein
VQTVHVPGITNFVGSSATQKARGSTFETELDPFLKKCIGIGHVTPGNPGKTYPVQGYLAHKKTPTPLDHHRALGIFLLYGHKGALFRMSKVSL